MSLSRTIYLVIASASLLSCAAGTSNNKINSSSSMMTPDFSDKITLERGGFTPEGLEYDHKNHRFMVGSTIEGRVFAVDGQGRMTTIVDDPDLDAVLGIEIEEDRNRILAVDADASVFGGTSQGHAKLGIYDLDTGSRIAYVDLAAAYTDAPSDIQFLPNDVVGDTAGNIYVTDSFGVVVYKVDTNMQTSVFVTRDQFPEEQSLNGIISHPDGYLLIAGSGTGAIYKADLRNPKNFTSVGLAGPVSGADGMVWAADGDLVIAAQGKAIKLHSDDNWFSARVVAEKATGAASTAATVGDETYVVFPHFADQDSPTIERVDFSSN